jgi:nitroreductase
MKTATVEDLVSSETLKTIYERRSVRKYKSKPVDRAIIEKIIDAGRMAPTAMIKQHWKFYVLTDRESIKLFSNEIVKAFAHEMLHSGVEGVMKLAAGALYNLYYGNLIKGPDIFYGAPVVVFITAAKDDPWACYDISMCAQNMMLAAKAMGLDSCPLGIGNYVERTKIYYRLKIAYPEEVFLAVVLGYGDEIPKVHTRITDNVFYVDEKGE